MNGYALTAFLLFIWKVHFGLILVYEQDWHPIDSRLRLKQEQTSVASICVVNHDASMLEELELLPPRQFLSSNRKLETLRPEVETFQVVDSSKISQKNRIGII